MSSIHCGNTAAQLPLLRQLASGSSSAHPLWQSAARDTRAHQSQLMGKPLPMSQGQVRTLKSSDTLLPCVFSISVLRRGGRAVAGAAVERRCLPCGGQHARLGGHRWGRTLKNCAQCFPPPVVKEAIVLQDLPHLALDLQEGRAQALDRAAAPNRPQARGNVRLVGLA